MSTNHAFCLCLFSYYVLGWKDTLKFFFSSAGLGARHFISPLNFNVTEFIIFLFRIFDLISLNFILCEFSTVF